MKMLNIYRDLKLTKIKTLPETISKLNNLEYL